MSFAPFAALWIALVAAAGVCALTARRPRIPNAVTLVASLLALALWLFFRPGDTFPLLAFAGRQWVMTDTTWALTGVSLFLALSAAVYAVFNREGDQGGARSAWILALTAASLPAVWAADDRTCVMGVALFGVVWTLAAFGRSMDEPGPDRARPALWLLAAIFPLWLVGVWPAARVSLTLLAAAMLVGVWPFTGWRKRAHSEAGFALLLDGLPVIVGAGALAAGLRAAPASVAEIVAATALGLIGLIAGLARAWEPSPGNVAKAIGLGFAGLALTTPVWAGEAALVAAVRLAVFAPALLTFSTGDRRQPGDQETARRLSLSPGLVGLLIAFLTIAGLPLTVGFGTLSPLYEAWRSSGGLVLVLALALILTFWLAAVFAVGRAIGRGTAADRASWLQGAALVVPALALLQFNPDALSIGALTWVALLIPPIVGVLLSRFLPNLEGLDGLLREATTLPPSAESNIARLRRIGQVAADAVGDALAILEGELGLLWLLGLLLLVLWLR